MFADQNHEHPDEQFGPGDIYLPDLTDLQAQGISTEGMQVSYVKLHSLDLDTSFNMCNDET